MDPAFRVTGSGLTEHTAFGLPLYPLTLGHVFLLTELEIDFLVDDVEPSLDDLITFVFVAAQPTSRGARQAVFSPLARLLFRFWGLVSRRRNVMEEQRRLAAYIQSQSASPRIAPPPSDRTTKFLNAPEHWRLLAMLMADFHFSMAEAMDTGVNFARALWAAEGERRDKHSLAWTPQTTAAINRLRSRQPATVGEN